MSADWYATLVSQKKRMVGKGTNLRRVFEKDASGERWSRFFEEVSLFTVLSEATAGPKQEVRDAYLSKVSPPQNYQIPAEGLSYLHNLALEPTSESLVAALRKLPHCSWFFSFRFRLVNPYLSQDDAPFYTIDNPVRKDKVLKLPLVAPTSWKGNLRAVLRAERGITSEQEEGEDQVLLRLFGNVKGEKREGHFRAGCLRCYPTFFTQLGQVVINPHNRAGGAGKQPIYFECVPRGATGAFTLLYVPAGNNEEEQTATQIALEDLTTMVDTTAKLLLHYGFGAKTGSGFGRVFGRFPQMPTEKPPRESGVVYFRGGTHLYGNQASSFNELLLKAWTIREKVAQEETQCD